MGLLFLNALKGLKNHKLQMISIIALLFLSTGIYSIMNISLDRIEDRYYTYLEEQNVEDFSFVANIDYEKEFNQEKVLNYLNNELKDISDDDKQIVYLYSSCFSNKSEYCNEYLYYRVNQIFEENGIIKKISEEKFNLLTEKYDFEFEIQSSKILKEENTTIKVFAYNKDKKINIPYLVEGDFPSNDDEITILKGYAKKNNLVIGDTYKIGDKTYHIVGFAYASDYIYPMLSINVPMFDEAKNNIIFTTFKEYENINGVEENVYAGKFNEKTDPRNRMEIVIEEDEDGNLIPKTNNPATTLFIDEQDIITRDMNTIFRSIRIDTMQMELESNRVFADYFLYLLLAISIIIIIIINKKRIEDERLQIGVLKSLGYKRFPIAISYLVYPIIGSLIGGLLGYFTGYFFNNYFAQLYLSYFNIVLADNVFNLTYLLQCVLIPMISLSILTFLVSLLMLRKKPLELLREGSDLKVNFLTKITNFITKKMKFEKRFKYSLASRSISKLLIVSITAFATGLLITLTLIGSTLFNSVMDESFKDLNFNYMVSYTSLESDESEDDLLLQITTNVVRVEDKNNKPKDELKEDYTLTLNGIDSNLKHMKITDKDGNDLLKQLTDKTIIINENIKKILNVDIGDYIVISINDEEESYEVVGSVNTYLGFTCYTKRDKLSEVLGFEDSIYNLKYTNDTKYENVSKLEKEEADKIGMIFSFEDLKENIYSTMEVYNISIYIVIFFAAIMVLVIIAVIANIIVEENKKTISLMKVMGYKDKKISKIILNIYTPFVIIFYLLSVPCMIKLLEKIVDVVAKDIDMTIPITVNIYQVIIGLLALLIGYFIAINMSKKTLNKVPLSIALKRE